ncbi:MAG: hypothetical protein GY711_15885 [bacterium]|nr:hypothetical protein [bacterium]
MKPVVHTPKLVLALTAAGAASCATYNERTVDALRAFENGRFEEAWESYGEDDVTRSEFLAGAEAGMACFAAGEWVLAIDYFSRAASAVRDFEEKALVSPERAASGLLSWAVNESFKDYHGEGFERVMLHATLGLAYLATGAVEDAMVEVRLADDLLTGEEDLYDTDYRAGGLGHFVSAIGFELLGRPDDAFIDYLRMEEKGLGGQLAGRALVRLAHELNRTDELPRLEERYGRYVAPPEDAARIIVVAGVGLGPFKEETRLDIPTGDGVLAWSVPSLTAHHQIISKLVLDVSGNPIETVVIENVASVAKENLDDRLAWLATKSAVRAVIKREMTQQLEEEHGGIGFLAGNLFALVTERADLRAWTTLPDTWQACRAFVSPGTHEVVLRANGGGTRRLGTFVLEPGETVFVYARTLQTRLYVHTIGGRRTDLAASEREAVGAE